jgi:shikimate dehydrogenase
MTSKHFAVIGSPINHSLSPAIHSAAYEFLGLDWDYRRFEIEAGFLGEFLAVSAGDISGLSVTMPLKVEAASLSIASDDIVRTLGVANTLIKSEGSWNSYNTDVFGLTMALGHAWNGLQRASIIGGGATAMSALYSIWLNCPNCEVKLYLRDISKGEAVLDLAARLGLSLKVLSLDEFSNEQDVTISTIPNEALIQLPQSNQSGWLLNVNYNKSDEEFRKQFDSEKVIAGQSMLVWQAIGQIRGFLHGDPSVEMADELKLYERMSAAL